MTLACVWREFLKKKKKNSVFWLSSLNPGSYIINHRSGTSPSSAAKMKLRGVRAPGLGSQAPSGCPAVQGRPFWGTLGAKLPPLRCERCGKLGLEVQPKFCRGICLTYSLSLGSALQFAEPFPVVSLFLKAHGSVPSLAC